MVVIIVALAVWLVGSIPASLLAGWWLRRAAGTPVLTGRATVDSRLLHATGADAA